MNLLRLKATQFRNLLDLHLEPSPGFNLIYGANGSGKTSILEAVHFLSLGRSFRTNLTNRIINYQTENFSVFGLIEDTQGVTINTGIEKNRHGKTRLKVGVETTVALADLARALPLQLINPDSYSLLTSGPRARREFIDWGLFHVEHQFFPLWQRFQRALKQRNACLRQALPVSQVKAWDQEIVNTAGDLAQYRAEYIQKLIPQVLTNLANLIDLPELDFSYHQGWDSELSLQQALDNSYARDVSMGYTHYGPQRADLILKTQGIPVQDALSRGEQKLLVVALRLAQGMLLQQLTGKRCIYLIDDLAAELDQKRRQQVINILTNLKSQVFITAVEQEVLQDLSKRQDSKMFHVEHGIIR